MIMDIGITLIVIGIFLVGLGFGIELGKSLKNK